MADGMFSGGFAGPGAYPGYANAPVYPINISQGLGISGPMGMLLDQVLGGLLPRMFGGNMQFGQFFPQMNLYDQFKRNTQFNMQREAMAAATKQDENTYRQMLQGIANLTGTPFGMRERAAADTMARDMATMMPFLLPFAPDLVDRMHGTRGSAAVMAMRMADASRFMIDPATGGIGLGQKRLEALNKDVFNKMFGDNVDIREMRGITAGQAGSMFDEMVRRGLMGGMAGTVSEVAKKSNMTSKDFMALPDFERRMQEFESNKIVDKLKGMTAAVSAMKDIFGENGRPDAPMSELMNALQAITQNNLGSMDPANVSRLVRNASNAAKIAGMSMDGMMALMAQSGSVTDRFGLNRAFAPGIGINAAAFGAAYGNMFGGNRGFGGMDKDKAVAAEARLQGSAAVSQQAQALAALMRMDEAGTIPDTPQGRALKDYARRIREGDTSAPVYTPTELSGMVSSAMGGAGASLFHRFMRQTDANQQTIAKYEIGDLVRTGGQPRDAALRINQMFRQGMVGIPGFQGNERAQNAAASVITDRLMNLTDEELKKYDNGDVSFLVDDVQKTLRGMGVNANPDQIRAALSVGRGNLETVAKAKGFETGGNYLASVNKRLLDQSSLNKKIIRAESAMQEEFSKLGRSGPMQRFVDAIMGAGPEGKVEDVLRDIFNGVSDDQIQAAVAAGLGKDLDMARALSTRDTRSDAASLADLLKDPVGNRQKIEEIANAYSISMPELLKMRGMSEEQISGRLKVRVANVRAQVAKNLPRKLRGLDVTTSNISEDAIQGTINAAEAGGGAKAADLAEAIAGDEGAQAMLTGPTKNRIVGGLTTAGKLLEGLEQEVSAADKAKVKDMDKTDLDRALGKIKEASNLKKVVDGSIADLAKKTNLTEKQLKEGIGVAALSDAERAELGPLQAKLEDARRKKAAARTPQEAEAANKEVQDAEAAIRGHAQRYGYNAASVLDPGRFKGLDIGTQRSARELFQQRNTFNEVLTEQADKIRDIAKSAGVSVAALISDPETAKMLKETYGINVAQLGREFKDINARGNRVVTAKEREAIKKEMEKRKEMETKPGEALNKLLKQLGENPETVGMTKEAADALSKADPSIRAEFSKAMMAADKLGKKGMTLKQMFEADVDKIQDPETKRLIREVRESGLMKRVAAGEKIDKATLEKEGAAIAKKLEEKQLKEKEKQASVVRLHSDTKLYGKLDLTDNNLLLNINPGKAANG